MYKVACHVLSDSSGRYFVEYWHAPDAVSGRPLFFCNLECTALGNASGLGRYCWHLYYKIKGGA